MQSKDKDIIMLAKRIENTIFTYCWRSANVMTQ